tara:strand:+ start:8731 stop:9645 length:915 start_codon:yes stop_codon:yes gene_type:complete
MQRTLWDFGVSKSPEEELEVYDLFCGIGGFSTGATLAGHRVVVAADCEKKMLVWHRANHPNAQHVRATLPRDEHKLGLPGPESAKRWLLHGSPPCVKLSAAKWEKTQEEIDDALDMIRWYFELALRQKPTFWTFEQVAVKRVLDVCETFRKQHPHSFAYAVVRCSDYGIPQMRRRVLGGSPKLIHALLKKRGTFAPELSTVAHWTPPKRGFCMYPKWSIRGRRLKASEMSISPTTGPGYSIIGSHVNYWCNHDGENKLVFSVREGARMQTFPDSTRLPRNARLAQRLVGNALPVRLAQLLLEKT